MTNTPFNNRLRQLRQSCQRLLRHAPSQPLDPWTPFQERLSLFNRTFSNVCVEGNLRHTPAATAKAWEPFHETGTYDLILNFWGLHAENAIFPRMSQYAKALQPDGLFLACLPGEKTLTELRQCIYEIELRELQGISPRVVPMLTVQNAGMLLQRAGFSLPVVDIDRHVLAFRDIFELIDVLRYWGETNCLNERVSHYVGRSFWHNVNDLYKERFPATNGIEATFEIMTMTAWGPSETQQKPLRPGSATHSMMEAFNTKP